jgi:hypothetical protein
MDAMGSGWCVIAGFSMNHFEPSAYAYLESELESANIYSLQPLVLMKET